MRNTNANHFSLCDNVLMYAQRVVVPTTLQKRLLKEFHISHPKILRIKSLMRSYGYWPTMNRDIEEALKSCKGCGLAAKSPATKWQRWPKTDIPWTRLYIDYAGPLKGSYYLLWWIVFQSDRKCINVTFAVTLSILHELFARYGILDTIVSDNGTQFMSEEFSKFCEIFVIEHAATPPYHPMSNGQADRFIDTFKRALKKATMK
ncbi:uncharacterized protein K02A2.6-like [Octopus sinensis]|uniref:Uncharacterized protein K02A2.6-like n=1 Tax=Octopus sinensis TaxID=2607531 RepID=A0A6P7T794_9MOLL|nr:uncharacterized protein K02A2.6-like [Octopus sinensis]